MMKTPTLDQAPETPTVISEFGILKLPAGQTSDK